VPQELVSRLRDVELRLLCPGIVLAWPETEIGTDRAGSREPAGVFYREHIGKRRQTTDSRHLREQSRFLVGLMGEGLDLVLQFPDLFAQGGDDADDRIKRRRENFRMCSPPS